MKTKISNNLYTLISCLLHEQKDEDARVDYGKNVLAWMEKEKVDELSF